MASHPPIAQLDLLAQGRLEDEEAAEIRVHLASCPECRAQHDECRANLELAGQLRGAVEAQPTIALADTHVSPEADAEAFISDVSIEGYRFLREIHRGGQGVIYQAVQESTRRKVAVKVMLEGPYASRSAQRRFEREIDIVAQLKHPNIIAIFDSGITAGGQRYYVMDYIRGLPLNRYVRDKKLSLDEALVLFAQVCDAVNYAHQKGVIHRDLKPSNILVDTAGSPKVLDFGLAKPVSEPMQTVVSMTGQVVGTLPYLSPEQARGNPDEIDIRTDVYALGVILYEFLTGHYPYPVVGQMADVLRHIAETAPTPPSRAWKPDSGVLKRSKQQRASKTSSPIDDEVQTIVLKSLSKERERRYQSAGELARDIAHYLAGEPIEAKKDSGFYVLRKTLRRYRAAASVAAAFVLLITGFALLMTIQSARIADQRDRARDAEQVAAQERDRALTAERIANEQRQLAEANLSRAEQAEKGAQEAARRAREEARNAEAARIDAETQRETVRRQLYFSQISLARRLGEAGWVDEANRLLDNGRPEQGRTDLRGWEWYFLKKRYVRRVVTLRGHEDYVRSVAWSPDGTRLASASSNKTLRIWDAGTGAEVRTLRGHERGVHSVAWSPDGTRLASASDDKTLRIWDAGTGAQVRTLRGHEAPVYSVGWSPDGTRLASASKDKTIRIWDAETGAEALTLRGHAAWVLSVAWSPDGFRLASGSFDKTLQIWDAGKRGWPAQSAIDTDQRDSDIASQPVGKPIAHNRRPASSQSIGLKRSKHNTGAALHGSWKTLITTPKEAISALEILSATFNDDGTFICMTRYDGSLRKQEKGTYVLSGGTLRLKLDNGSELTYGCKPMEDRLELTDDSSGRQVTFIMGRQ